MNGWRLTSGASRLNPVPAIDDRYRPRWTDVNPRRTTADGSHVRTAKAGLRPRRSLVVGGTIELDDEARSERRPTTVLDETVDAARIDRVARDGLPAWTGVVAAVLAATAVLGHAMVGGSVRPDDPPLLTAAPSTSAVTTPSSTQQPSPATRFERGDVLLVTGDGLGDPIEAYPGNRLYVVDVALEGGVAAYLVEGPARSHSEEASAVSLPARTIETNSVRTDMACPDPPRSISELEGVPPFGRALCFENRLTLEDVWVEAARTGHANLGNAPDGLLSGFAEVGSGTLPYSVGEAATLPGPGWFTVTGRFGRDDPTCGDPFGMLRCRERFVIEVVRPGASPFTTMEGSWSRMKASSIEGRSSYVAIPTDRGSFIWGGEPEKTGAGAAMYDAGGNRWIRTAPSPEGGRIVVAAAWSGTEVLIWGGMRGQVTFGDGLSFDPRRDRWRAIPLAPIKPGFGYGAWTGREFVVVSSSAESAAWDPTNRGWRRLPDAPLPPGHMESVWTGRDLLVLGVGEGGTEPVEGAALDVSTWRWRTIAEVPYDGLILGIKPVWTGEQMLFAGHAYEPATDQWKVLRRDGCTYRAVEGVWTGRYVINQTQAFDPELGRCFTLPESPDRPGFGGIRTHEFHTPFWADGRLVVWSGGTGLDGPSPPPDGIVFTPSE